MANGNGIMADTLRAARASREWRIANGSGNGKWQWEVNGR